MGRKMLNNEISEEDFLAFYWLKEELISFCRQKNIRTSGKKEELINRILHYLQTEKLYRSMIIRTKRKNTFLLTGSMLPLQKILLLQITIETQKMFVLFSKKQLGNSFHFTTAFMSWMKENKGKTLHEAAIEWERLKKEKKIQKERSPIEKQFEYNQYIRDFLKANPHLKMKDAIYSWKIKKEKRRSNMYDPSDLLGNEGNHNDTKLEET